MGVVRQRKSNACDPSEEVPAEQIDTVESSDNETVEEERVSNTPNPSTSNRHVVSRKNMFAASETRTPTIKRNVGRRRYRQYFNKVFLESMPTSEDITDEVMEQYKSPFERLMEFTEDAIDFLNRFLGLENKTQDKSNKSTEKTCKEVEPYKRITHKIRKSLKSKKNFPCPEHEKIENDLLMHFKEAPVEEYYFNPGSCFERLFMHGLCQYYGLHSINSTRDGGRIVKVWNENDKTLAPVEPTLCIFLQKRKL